jgi:integrase
MQVAHYLARVQIAPSSMDTYKVCLLKLERWLDAEGIPVEEMSRDDFIRFTLGIPSPNTARLHHSAARSYATKMKVETELLDKENYIKRVQSEPREGLKATEFYALLDTIDRSTLIGKRDAAMLLVCVGGGGYRSNELANMQVKHVNLDELEVTAYRKGGEWHTAAITEEAAEALEKWFVVLAEILARYNIRDHGFVFVGIKTGRPMTRHGIYGRVNKELGPRIHRPDLHAHDLRRTMCMTMIRNDASDSKVMEQGNWSDHNSFKRYKRGIAPRDTRKHLIRRKRYEDNPKETS